MPSGSNTEQYLYAANYANYGILKESGADVQTVLAQSLAAVQDRSRLSLADQGFEADGYIDRMLADTNLSGLMDYAGNLNGRIGGSAGVVQRGIRRNGDSSTLLGAQKGFGEMVEYMVVPNLVTKFNELGFEFEKTHRDTVIKDPKHDIFTEVDVFLENGNKVMIVETKTKPSIDDINDHIERMEKLRRYADLHNDKRKYLGAIAGMVFGDSEKTYALKKGFYVIEPSGDTFNITEPTGKYYPHEW
ncbi:hypothetical protein AGMMS50268_26510 [Spirochaetia bacterium]|nr:hypothetical protein AGMMS50268_26510 [Spirochaetia bacterium]